MLITFIFIVKRKFRNLLLVYFSVTHKKIVEDIAFMHAHQCKRDTNQLIVEQIPALPYPASAILNRG